ncbi:sugar transferase, partial [Campylobacter jejuni]|nr:sugar transferase [Campylobacter jejuni]
MYNPNSAIERIKNHLAYKLGQAMIDFTNNGGGYIALFKKLYQIKRQHKKEQKIYQQTIQVFPQLKYPSLEACSDYEQALKYKFHLSYMLGEVLIKADKTWYKGGGFKLKNNIKKAKKEFQIFREIFKEFDQINSSILKGLIDNKQLFLKEFPRIKHILKIHQDYKAILDNIFHNFNYFIQNFDLIEEWLLLDGFKEKYKKENHPYPSLLDPKKLNDENEKINYKNIPAELAWEMNLPLPRNYRFIFITGGSCGHMAMFLYFKLLKINRNWTSETEKEKYKIAYNVFIASKEYNIFSCQWDKITQKLFYLVDFNVPLVVLLRDPIERLKSLTNHIVKHITKFDLTLNPNEALVNKYYKMKDYPSLEKVDTIVDYPNYFDIFSKITYFKNITEVFILDTKD